MKISIKNFGPIDHFEFDLEKDLHVIYGENNIGKSWAISVVYLILKSYVKFIETDTLITKARVKSSHVNEIKEYIFGLKKIDDINKIALNDSIKEISKENFNIFTNFLSSSLKNTFSIIGNTKFGSLPLIEINTKNFQSVLKIEDKEATILSFNLIGEIYFEYDFNKSFTDDFIQLVKEYIRHSKKINKLQSEYFKELKEDIENQIPFEIEYLGEYIFRRKLEIVPNVYFLPSSREGLHHQFSNFGHILAELSRFRFQIKSQFKIPKLSEPIADYLQNLSQVSDIKTNSSLAHIAQKIEKEILKAQIWFDESKSEIKFIDDRTNFTLDILEASSMIAEIAPLVIFIRHIIKISISSINRVDNILFIEEPEAHLHPKVQVEMMKVFVDLAKSGVKVVMTTHSDFMMDTLTNQILDGKIDADKIASYHLEMGDKGSYDVGDMKATSEGIRDFNFSKTSVALYEERMQLLEKKQEAEDAD